MIDSCTAATGIPLSASGSPSAVGAGVGAATGAAAVAAGVGAVAGKRSSRNTSADRRLSYWVAGSCRTTRSRSSLEAFLRGSSSDRRTCLFRRIPIDKSINLPLIIIQ